jgi:ribosomal protein S12 methylthiotransferase accessory factor
MEYSIYKDCNVNQTVEKIKNILKEVGIEVEEEVFQFPFFQTYMPYSTRLRCFGINDIGTNGKGTCYENASASGYAEFMERLQNKLLEFLSDIPAPDEKVLEKNDNTILYEYYNKDIIDFANEFVDFTTKPILSPYFSIKKRKLEYLLLNILKYIQGSNGMCAGNTPEEALVQGFSEICERYASREIFLNKITMPDIPKKIWEQYENIKGLVKYIESCGYSVQIKDASLGKNLPVICTIFENQNMDLFTIKFGAQPSLPVAIERTLTEFCQGNPFKKEFLNQKNTYISNETNSFRYRHNLFELYYHRILLFNKENNKFFEQIKNPNATYQFNSKVWIDERENLSNKDLLIFLVNNIAEISNNDIYVRDVSFLNFPAYDIFIPNMSCLLDLNTDFAKFELNRYCWCDYLEDKIDSHKDINSLILALEYEINFINQRIGRIITEIPNEYLILLCYIIKDDIEKIIEISDIIINNRIINDPQNLIKIIKYYYKYKKEGLKNEEITQTLKKEFDIKDIENFETFKIGLSFDRIKKLIANSNIERIKRDRENFKKFGQLSIDIKNKLFQVEENLIQKYKENTPDQNNLASIFDFIQ